MRTFLLCLFLPSLALAQNQEFAGLTEGGGGCGAGQVTCSGACVTTNTDRLNCGSCGNACASGQVCTSSSCAASCLSGQTYCSGTATCAVLNSDPTNCGSCGTACVTGSECRLGTCVLISKPGPTQTINPNSPYGAGVNGIGLYGSWLANENTGLTMNNTSGTAGSGCTWAAYVPGTSTFMPVLWQTGEYGPMLDFWGQNPAVCATPSNFTSTNWTLIIRIMQQTPSHGPLWETGTEARGVVLLNNELYGPFLNFPTTSVMTTTPNAANTWYTYTIVQTNMASQIYVNGQPTISGTGSAYNWDVFHFGTNYQASTFNFDYAQYYKQALTAPQVAYLYQHPFAAYAYPQKPPVGTTINTGLTISANILGAWLDNEAAGTTLTDASTGAHSGTLVPTGGSANWGYGDYGPQVMMVATSPGVSIAGLASVALPVSVMTIIKPVDAVAGFPIQSLSYAGDLTFTIMANQTGAGNVTLRNGSGYFNATTTVSAGTDYVIIATIAANGAAALWVNGTKTSGAVSTTSPIWPNGLGINGSPAYVGGNNYHNGTIVWGRILSDAEIATLTADPWAPTGY